MCVYLIYIITYLFTPNYFGYYQFTINARVVRMIIFLLCVCTHRDVGMRVAEFDFTFT